MTANNIPIMSLRLLDIPLPEGRYTKVNFIGAAKDLLRTHLERAEAAGIDLQVFHNKAIAYSGIQLGSYQKAPEWTAYGEEAVEALWFWLALYQENHPDQLRNSVMVQEHYLPEFMEYPKDYRISPLLISDGLAKKLNPVRDEKSICQLLEKYLYGNLQTFFKYIGFTYDKEAHYLKVTVQKAIPFDRAMPVFHLHKKTAFDITFKVNFRLPQSLRLGQSTALGYGNVFHL